MVKSLREGTGRGALHRSKQQDNTRRDQAKEAEERQAQIAQEAANSREAHNDVSRRKEEQRKQYPPGRGFVRIKGPRAVEQCGDERDEQQIVIVVNDRTDYESNGNQKAAKDQQIAS